jgi:hypothetical protein
LVPVGNWFDVVVTERGNGAPIVTVYACVPFCGGLLVSVTWIVNATLLCCVVGVPPIVAVALFEVRIRPAGRVPTLTLHVNGPSPLLAVRTWLYNVPTLPFGSVLGLMDGAGGKLMRMLRACVIDCVGLLESVTFTVKFAVVLGPSGVPVMCPDAFIARPGGNVPALVLNVKVPKPVATTCWL